MKKRPRHGSLFLSWKSTTHRVIQRTTDSCFFPDKHKCWWLSSNFPLIFPSERLPSFQIGNENSPVPDSAAYWMPTSRQIKPTDLTSSSQMPVIISSHYPRGVFTAKLIKTDSNLWSGEVVFALQLLYKHWQWAFCITGSNSLMLWLRNLGNIK